MTEGFQSQEREWTIGSDEKTTTTTTTGVDVVGGGDGGLSWSATACDLNRFSPLKTNDPTTQRPPM